MLLKEVRLLVELSGVGVVGPVGELGIGIILHLCTITKL